jgi:hypothetical protein
MARQIITVLTDDLDASAINHADQMHVAPLSVRWPDNGALFAVAIELCSLSPKYVRSAVAAMRVCLAAACSRADESPALLTQRPP